MQRFILLALEFSVGVEAADAGGSALIAARPPILTNLASQSRVGAVWLTPPDLAYGPARGALTMLGYDASGEYPGVGPLVAAANDVRLDSRDVALRATLCASDGQTLTDAVPDALSNGDGRMLATFLRDRLGSRRLEIIPGVAHRHLVRWPDGSLDIETVPPVRALSRPLSEVLPDGDGAEALRTLVWDSLEILDAHPINARRRDLGQPPANALWPWGQGRSPELRDFFRLRGRRGAVISANELVRGVGRAAGLAAYPIPDSHSDPAMLTIRETLTRALDSGAEIALVHIGRRVTEDMDEKIAIVSDTDSRLIGPLLQALRERREPWKLLAVAAPDNARAEASPYLIHDPEQSGSGNLPFDERAIAEARSVLEDGARLIGEVTG